MVHDNIYPNTGNVAKKVLSSLCSFRSVLIQAVVARIDLGEILWATTSSINAAPNALVVEAKAATLALSTTIESKIQFVIVEGDAQVVIRDFNGEICGN
ncbi:hypothetical protein F8388_010222 [Cannabis sativa]|uniref:RNase H type-1 domain-containing protein n=1 Tax=Cannabis sativa TaxID=3483 RepID=A0A7J6GRU2_CANSA|nr:hypothetical protein G4B88_029721 [Cannabis sativa]KAF4385666.1 hypothetical protein F8388_010222 [Cannabis sativa]